MARRRLTPLEEHLAWIFQHGGWRRAIHASKEDSKKDFSEAPIKAWCDAREKKPRRRKVDAR